MADGAHGWYPVPKDAKEARCPRGCGATVYWIETKRAGHATGTVRMPIDTSVRGGEEPDSMSGGRGVNHFTICKQE